MGKEMFNGSKSAKTVKEFGDTQKGFDVASKLTTEDIKPKGFDGEWSKDKPLTIKEVGNTEKVAGKTND